MLTMISAFLICASGLCQRRCAVGIDLGRIISTSGVNLSAGLGFSDKWSASWQSEIDLTPLHNKDNQEYMEHLSQTEEARTKEKIFQSSSIAFQYWINQPYEGVYLETGIMEIKNTRASHIIGFGYFIPIWKGIRGCISYRYGSAFSFGLFWTI